MKKLWKTVAFVAAVMTVAVAPPAKAQARLISGIGLCIQPVGGMSSLDGDHIQQVPCSPYDPSYFWVADFVRNINGQHYFHIRNVGTQRCLDLTDGITADWTPLQQWTCNNTSTTMLWTYDPNGNTRFINARSNKCMDVQGGSDLVGTLIQNYHCAARTSPGNQINYAQIWNWY